MSALESHRDRELPPDVRDKEPALNRVREAERSRILPKTDSCDPDNQNESVMVEWPNSGCINQIPNKVTSDGSYSSQGSLIKFKN